RTVDRERRRRRHRAGARVYARTDAGDKRLRVLRTAWRRSSPRQSDRRQGAAAGARPGGGWYRAQPDVSRGTDGSGGDAWFLGSGVRVLRQPDGRAGRPDRALPPAVVPRGAAVSRLGGIGADLPAGGAEPGSP